jgi:hypothetical protein
VILAIDSTALVLLINPGASPPIDPSTGQPVTFARERVERLIADLDAKTDIIIVPTPVLAEVLVKAGAGAAEILGQLGALARIRIRSFDQRSAVEVAAMTIEALADGGKKGGSEQPWQKVKFDRQIIAIARVNGATHIYADDKNLSAFARSLGHTVISTWDLPEPEVEDNLFSVAGVIMAETSDELRGAVTVDLDPRQTPEWLKIANVSGQSDGTE